METPPPGVQLTIPPVFDRRRRDPLWRITEKLSGEDKVTSRAVNLFYEQVDRLIRNRLDAKARNQELEPSEGVDLLELFLQTTDDPFQLSGMVFTFLSAAREYTQCLLFHSGS